jgi:ADP-heptose:LPS heptosyltransferase
MNVAWMRKVDYVLGNAVCSALAAVKTLSRSFKKGPSEIRKIVVMKFFGMGSIVVASPALAALRDTFPNAEIHFVTFKANREILEILDLTDVNHYVDPTTTASFTRTTLLTIKALRDAEIDLAIDLEFYAKYSLVLSNLAGVRKHAGYYLALESWRKTLLDVMGWYNHYYHTKDIFLSLPYLLATEDPYFLEFEKFAARYAYPRIVPSASDRDQVKRVLGPRRQPGAELIVINPNASPDVAPEARKWPEARYAEVARRLLRERPGACVAFIGAKSERAYVQRIVDAVGSSHAFSMAGELSIRELLALFADAALVLSNDSGPMHLACLVDAPTAGLFFADAPTLFAPVGSNVCAIGPRLYSIPLYTVYNGKDIAAGRPSSQVTNAASLAVSVDDVLDAVRPMFGARSTVAAVGVSS